MEGGSIEPFTEQDLNTRLPKQFGIPVGPMEQTGILRTNCIDCLDRTNVAQFSAGVEAMGQQLVVMGIRSNPKLDPSSNIVRVLIDIYVDIGDHIALQYGGSEAHKKVSSERSESIVGPIGKHKELLTSIRRYYSNAFTDRLKQDAMNLFLGFYVPFRHTIPLWEIETDYYLHNFHVRGGLGTKQSMKAYQVAFGVSEWGGGNDPEASKEKEPHVLQNQRGLSRMDSQFSVTGSTDAVLMQEDDMVRIQRVRDRCQRQTESLSIWWKVAIQGNVQQRMWMQTGTGNLDHSLLPPRFDRLYQPGKLAQFDRFFARPWATPVRRSHAAQHTPDSEGEGEIAEFHRNMTGRKIDRDAAAPTLRGLLAEETALTIDKYIDKNGFTPHREPSMKEFLEHHHFGEHEFDTLHPNKA